jgi:hypothetical protein
MKLLGMALKLGVDQIFVFEKPGVVVDLALGLK